MGYRRMERRRNGMVLAQLGVTRGVKRWRGAGGEEAWWSGVVGRCKRRQMEVEVPQLWVSSCKELERRKESLDAVEVGSGLPVTIEPRSDSSGSSRAPSSAMTARIGCLCLPDESYYFSCHAVSTPGFGIQSTNCKKSFINKLSLKINLTLNATFLRRFWMNKIEAL